MRLDGNEPRGFSAERIGVMRILDSYCLFGSWPRDPRDASIGRLLAVLEDLGIERGVCASLRGAFYDHESGNEETLRACDRHESLVPAATINPRHYYSRRNLPAELVGQGFRLLRLFPDLQGWSPHSVVVERIFSECTEVGLPMAFPIGKLPDLASLLARKVPEGCPLILSDAYYNELSEIVEVMRRRPEFFMEVGHTCVPGSVEFLCRDLGADRLVLGTHQPLESGRGPIEAIRRSEISEVDQAAVLGGNLSRLLGGIQ
jgi:predicted TIM-barrel fold metal-dependent hydrolase